jgi:PhnB protein
MKDVSPELSVRRGQEAVEFYEQAFGAEEIYRVGGNEANPAVVSQLAIGEASFWVSDESPRHHGWLLGRIEDPFGHHWEIGRPLGPWPPQR